MRYKGSVQERNGSWCYVVDLGRDSNGKRKQKRKSGFPTKDLAEKALLELNLKLKNKAKVQKVSKSDKLFLHDLPERIIEEIITKNINILENGMRIIGTQKKIENGVIDIIAKDRNNVLTIIEVKSYSSDGREIYQSIYYPSVFDETTRMIIIAPHYKESVYESLKEIHRNIRPIEIMKLYCNDNEFRIKPYKPEKSKSNKIYIHNHKSELQDGDSDE
ncbi:endonuclease NucS domain-containing protein [Halalkalibacter oceani]|uniref:endonuclease NucS domain-containing protein n=1 Tax=Halalkalibacter oceani TaxID=1653776 RepID=UPI003394F56E